MIDTLRLTAEEAMGLLERGEVSGRRAARGLSRGDRCAERGAALLPDARRRRRQRRRPDRAQGRDLDEGCAHDRRLEDPRGLRAGVRLDRRRRVARPRGCSCSARRTRTSSRWARRRRTPPTGRRATHGIPRVSPAARAAGLPRPCQPAWLRGRSARTPAARSSSRRRSAATSGCGRPTAPSRATASSRSRRASTRSGR